MPQSEGLDEVRRSAAAFERALDPARRKRLGQFYTGLPLARLLAALVGERAHECVLDPMCGHGDLLDAVIELHAADGRQLKKVAGIDIDLAAAHQCRQRLAPWRNAVAEPVTIIDGNAFSEDIIIRLGRPAYDLVIANPPFVRYQAMADGSSRLPSGEDVRAGLRRIAARLADPDEAPVWHILIDKYSGLSDLSIPSWILCSLLVRKGGLIALVAPASWLSRDYGLIVQYLLRRFFRLRCIVQDSGEGWFSDALIRTTLVVAERLGPDEAGIPIGHRRLTSETFAEVRIGAQAAGAGSVVGAVFPECAMPERALAEQIFSGQGDRLYDSGVRVGYRCQFDDNREILDRIAKTSWGREAEPATKHIHVRPVQGSVSAPLALRDLLEADCLYSLASLSDYPIGIGQGLRTGCNAFYYVDEVGAFGKSGVRIRASDELGGGTYDAPPDVLVPVIRRQAELPVGTLASAKSGRVLVLDQWVLPEDKPLVDRYTETYLLRGEPLPRIMPPSLADLVRRAGATSVTRNGRTQRIPELSAVRTNIRSPAVSSKVPRFWYMLPTMAHRHQPQVFIARVNAGVPKTFVNASPRTIVDANFSTLWSTSPHLTAPALAALLNSSWARACMEAMGVILGGGALKLEASQLRILPLPLIERLDLEGLDRLGCALDRPDAVNAAQEIDNLVAAAVLARSTKGSEAETLARRLTVLATTLAEARQRRPR